MPLLFINTINSEFRSRDDGAEYDGPEAAMALGVRSAVAMAAEEIASGQRNSAIEIAVEREGGVQELRPVLTISVSPLLMSR